MAMDDDEPTMIRRSDPDESTRAVDRAAELAPEEQVPPTADRAGSGDRVAVVPGAVPEAPVYGVRRDTSPSEASAPRTPRSVAPTHTPTVRAARRRPSVTGPLLVVAFGALIVAAAVVLVILVTA